MARPTKKAAPAAGAAPDADLFEPTPAVPEPILNGPYDEPTWYWQYKKVGEGHVTPQKTPGRRPASYFYKDRSATRQLELIAQTDTGADSLELVNRLRHDVRRWREARQPYNKATTTTKALLNYWFNTPDRPGRRFFFCQREAVETVIYLLELALNGTLTSGVGFKPDVDQALIDKLRRGERTGLEVGDVLQPRLCDDPGDGRLALLRLGCKMATGSGKTLVMAMLITWAFVNRALDPKNERFPRAVLVMAPNLTVRKRLRVLLPEEPGNYYDEFGLVPPALRGTLGEGKVLITNWHAFQPREPNTEGGQSYRVIDKGEEPADAFTRSRLGTLADAKNLPILVLNDEGHHCWRPRLGGAVPDDDEDERSAEERRAAEEDAEEARVWLAGLDRINNAGLRGKGADGRPLPCVLAAVDLSATPFYLANSGYPEGSPFPWLVSDFGLLDAIESGIVKVPRLPLRDDSGKTDDAGRPDPKFFRLWHHIAEKSKTQATSRVRGRMKPEFVFAEAQSALVQLAGEWATAFRDAEVQAAGAPFVPPVLIVVCDDTDLARHVYEKISGEAVVEGIDDAGKKVQRTVYGASALQGEVGELLGNTEGARRTIRIDSKLLSTLETAEDPGKAQTRDQAALALRTLIDTVGRPGQPGADVRCVVSVSMLTEGWDANNVRFILGLRAFGSQLLCEQVVGRGLRRVSYEIDKATGRLREEQVEVYGIPFSLIPFRGKAKGDPKPEKPQQRVFSVPGRERFRVAMPLVEGFTYDIRESELVCDIDAMDELFLDKEPGEVYVAPPLGMEADGSTVIGVQFQRQTRAEYYRTVRLQQVVFQLAQQVMADLLSGQTAGGDARLAAVHRLFPQVVRLVREYVDKKVRVRGTEIDKREVGLEKYARLLRERLGAGLKTQDHEGLLLPRTNRKTETLDTADVDYQTARPLLRLGKSELNAAVLRSDGGDGIGERTAIDLLEELDCVEAYAPNDGRVGFQVPYEYEGVKRRYEPDFVVRLRGGEAGRPRYVLVEVKGGKGEVHGPDLVRAKDAAAKQWVKAVNNAGRFGEWSYLIARTLGELRAGLEAEAGKAAAALPFALVRPAARDAYRSCVPLLGLRAALARAQAAQGVFVRVADEPGEWAAWARPSGFAQGMFVARYFGVALEPEVPAGSYCLFQSLAPGAPRAGRLVLVAHPGVFDEELGGNFTVRRYESAPRDDGRRQVRLRGADGVIDLVVDQETEVQVLAELVEVIRGA